MSVSNTRPPRKIITTHRCVRMTMNAICCFLMILQSKRSTVFRRCDGYVDLCAGTACPRCARRRRTRPRDNWEEPDPDGTIEKQEADDANGLGEYESGHDTQAKPSRGMTTVLTRIPSLRYPFSTDSSCPSCLWRGSTLDISSGRMRCTLTRVRLNQSQRHQPEG